MAGAQRMVYELLTLPWLLPTALLALWAAMLEALGDWMEVLSNGT